MPCLRLLRIRLTHIFHPNPTFLDKVKGLEYTATLIVDFLLFKAKLYNFRHKIFYFTGLLQPRRPQKALIKTSFFWFSAPFFVGSLALMAQRSCLSKMEMRMHHFGAQSHYM